MLIADLKDGVVLVCGQPYAELDSTKAKAFLRECPRDQMSSALSSKVWKIVVDKHRCPECGRADQFRLKIRVDGVQIGYCLPCREDVAIDGDGEWHSIWHSWKTHGWKQSKTLFDE